MNNRKRKKQLKKCKERVLISDIWNLDFTICEFVLPRLRKYKRLEDSHPANVGSSEEWQEILSKMIRGFELAGTDDLQIRVKHKEEIQEGLHLFADYFNALWI